MAASPNATIENRNGPAREGSPTSSPARPPAPERLGPSTAPIVVAQTTVESSVPRCSATTPSIAA